MARLRCVYCDLDGTLLGARASFLHDAEGSFSLLGARALEACDRAGVEVAIYSGRQRATLMRDARTLGLRSYVFEAGAGVVLDGELHWLVGGPYGPDGDRNVRQRIEASGAPALLLSHYAGRLEHHDPFVAGREVGYLMRGEVDAAEADALLEEHGYGDLRLLDNGAIARRSKALPGIERPRAYHLIPRGISKAGGVAFHMRARGYAREECIAVGDSREDLGASEAVETFWLVANGLAGDPSLRDALGPRVRVCEGANGAGVYEAVITELAERR
jgi:hydroxymethylpyrimidine pyrophosphatase-like HAD family hydrolase